MENIKITDETKFDYEDMEVKYNDETNQFYFLYTDLNESDDLVYYDAVSGSLLNKEDLKGYRHYDKASILDKERKYSPQDMELLNNELNSTKVNYTFGGTYRKK